MLRLHKYITSTPFRHIAIMVFGFLYCAASSMAQDPFDRLVIKDLRTQYAESTDLYERAFTLYDYCLYYKVKDYQTDSVVKYANQLIVMASDEKYPIAAVLGHRMLGRHYTAVSKYKEGRFHQYKSMKLANDINFTHHIFDSYHSLASNYLQENKLDSALYYFNRSIESAPEDMYSKRSYFHGGIASVYNMLGRYDMQEKHLLLSYENGKKANIRLDQIIALTGLLDLFSLTIIDPIKFNLYKKEYDSLMSYYTGFRSNLHSNFFFLDSLSAEESTDFLKKSLEDNMEQGYTEGVYFNYMNLQRLYIKGKQFQKCVDISNAAIAFYNSKNGLRLKLLVELYKNKWIAESKLNDPSKAFETIEYYHYLKDSLQATTNAESINELSLKYETVKKDAQISEMEIKNNNRTSQRNYAILVSALLLGLGLFLWRRSKYKQDKIEAKNKLQAEQITNLEKEKKILSLTSMLEGQESERTRIAQDLHDGLGGLLSSVRNHFSLIEVEVKKLDKLNIYDRTNSMIDQACKEVRRISHNLMPASLQLNGLVATVEEYCRDIQNTAKLKVQFEDSGIQDFQLDDTKEIFIYRIIQEAVTNVLKHAEANTLLVQLGYYEGEISLIIEDDGKGFSPDDKKGRIGLQSIKSRVDHLKGNLDIDSRIDQGTTITINIPHE